MSTEESVEKGLKQAIAHHEQAQLKLRLQGLEARRNKIRKLRMISAIAAGIVLLAVIGVLLFPSKDLDSQALYATHFSPYPNALAPVTRTAPEDTLNQAFEAYERGAYVEAITGFKQMLERKNDSDIRFYLGMSLQSNSQHEEALGQYAQISPSSTRFQPQLHWYMALLYIQNEQFVEAAQSLERLLESDSPYKQTAAKELLEAIN